MFSLFMLRLLCECEETDVVLGIRSELGETHQVDAILLSVETSWKIVSVSLVVAVVEAENIAKLFSAESRFELFVFLILFLVESW